jgi:N-methylhydantoinase A
VQFEADLRFKRQKWELAIPLDADRFGDAAFDQLLRDFRSEYARRYGEGALVAGATVELVGLRAIGFGRTLKAVLDGASTPARANPDASPRIHQRLVHTERGRTRTVDLYAREDLSAGIEVVGPALIDAADTTVWVPDRTRLQVDEHDTMVMEVGR